MAHHPETPFHSDDVPVEHPAYRPGIGLTQWMGLGLLLFALVMVILAIFINFILGSPGN